MKNPEHPTDGSDFKRRTLGKDRRYRDVHADQETEVEMDRTYTEERKWSHQKRGLGLEPAGEKEEGETYTYVAKNCPQWGTKKGKSWNEVKRVAGNRTRWRCFVDALCTLKDDKNWWWWWWWVTKGQNNRKKMGNYETPNSRTQRSYRADQSERNRQFT